MKPKPVSNSQALQNVVTEIGSVAVHFKATAVLAVYGNVRAVDQDLFLLLLISPDGREEIIKKKRPGCFPSSISDRRCSRSQLSAASKEFPTRL